MCTPNRGVIKNQDMCQGHSQAIHHRAEQRKQQRDHYHKKSSFSKRSIHSIIPISLCPAKNINTSLSFFTLHCCAVHIIISKIVPSPSLIRTPLSYVCRQCPQH
jgi:hypothetical protein